MFVKGTLRIKAVCNIHIFHLYIYHEWEGMLHFTYQMGCNGILSAVSVRSTIVVTPTQLYVTQDTLTHTHTHTHTHTT